MKPLLPMIYTVLVLLTTLALARQQRHSCDEFEGERMCNCIEGEFPGAECNGKNLEMIPRDLPNELVNLDLAFNKIEAIDNAHMYPALTTFNISYNNLKIIKEDCFKTNGQLQRLDLSHNLLTNITLDTFLGLHSILDLDLSHNQISTIMEDAFSAMPSLRDLYLAHNALHQLNSQTFPMHLRSTLQTLDLSHNHINVFPTSAISHLSNLRALRVGENSFQEISTGIFTNFDFLVELRLNDCGLRTLDADVFDGLDDLEILDISDNVFREVPESALVLDSLETLHIGGNYISRLDSNHFRKLSRLMNFYMNDCRDVALELGPDVFMHNRDLQVINITLCDLGNPDESVNLHHLHKLKHVNLHGNKLTTLPDNFLPMIDLASLDLSGCPLQCDCNLKWLRNWPNVNPQFDLKASCFDGALLTNMMDLDIEYYTCGLELAYIILIIVLAVLVILLALGLFLCRKRLGSRSACSCTIKPNFLRSPLKRRKSSGLRLSANYKSKQDIKVLQNDVENNGKFIDLPGLHAAEDMSTASSGGEDEEHSPIYDTVANENANLPDVKITQI
eukprot:TRINITY_DN29434_c0_g1_i4.p1 TRINITY_DN29434_c0_g1~~TRINITY_DN29434_c0_g1_i4.p1  ORF type:complete len:562 (-),score=87.92 TRINITY_DN29434_c0_g1_i4:88-1773(-)